MKVNKAPEKIWIDNLDEGFWFDSPSGNKSIEYTRTDAFIEKAVNFLNCSLSGVVAIKNGNTTQGLLRTKSEFVESFKKYMKGE